LMMDYKEVEILIPVTDEIVTSIDITTKCVFTTLPDGLIEIYLNEDVAKSDED
jgi:16S rRNA processing protein RimM